MGVGRTPLSVVDEKTWVDELRGDARRMAVSDAPRIKVLSGPGTGKTFATMARVRWLLEQGAAPERIFVVTLTRTAAEDREPADQESGGGVLVSETDAVRAARLRRCASRRFPTFPVSARDETGVNPALGVVISKSTRLVRCIRTIRDGQDPDTFEVKLYELASAQQLTPATLRGSPARTPRRPTRPRRMHTAARRSPRPRARPRRRARRS